MSGIEAEQKEYPEGKMNEYTKDFKDLINKIGSTKIGEFCISGIYAKRYATLNDHAMLDLVDYLGYPNIKPQTLKITTNKYFLTIFIGNCKYKPIDLFTKPIHYNDELYLVEFDYDYGTNLDAKNELELMNEKIKKEGGLTVTNLSEWKEFCKKYGQEPVIQWSTLLLSIKSFIYNRYQNLFLEVLKSRKKKKGEKNYSSS